MKYFCKCGKEIEKSTNAGTTGNKLENYGPGHECFGCPFVCENVVSDSYDQQLKIWTRVTCECRMSQNINYESYCQGLSNSDYNTGSIFSLDVEFLNEVANTANAKFADGFDYKVKPVFKSGTDYSTDGLYRLTLCPTKNKKGKAAKQGIRDMFFDENGKRKDWTPGQERIIVLSHIENEKQRARGCIEVEDKEIVEVETAVDTDVGDNTEDSTAVEGLTLPIAPNIEFEQSVTGGFDYSTVDEETAEFLKQRENLIKENTSKYATQLGRSFKDAQDRLAKHYQGGFEKWYTALGFSGKTVYNLINRFILIGSVSDTERDLVESLPAQLSYSISSPSAPSELVKKVLSGDISTNAEYQKLKKELEDIKEEKIENEQRYGQAVRERIRATENEKEVRRQMESYWATIDELKNTNKGLVAEIKELKDQPTDIEFIDVSSHEIVGEPARAAVKSFDAKHIDRATSMAVTYVDSLKDILESVFFICDGMSKEEFSFIGNILSTGLAYCVNNLEKFECELESVEG